MFTESVFLSSKAEINYAELFLGLQKSLSNSHLSTKIMLVAKLTKSVKLLRNLAQKLKASFEIQLSKNTFYMNLKLPPTPPPQL